MTLKPIPCINVSCKTLICHHGDGQSPCSHQSVHMMCIFQTRRIIMKVNSMILQRGWSCSIACWINYQENSDSKEGYHLGRDVDKKRELCRRRARDKHWQNSCRWLLIPTQGSCRAQQGRASILLFALCFTLSHIQHCCQLIYLTIIIIISPAWISAKLQLTATFYRFCILGNRRTLQVLFRNAYDVQRRSSNWGRIHN